MDLQGVVRGRSVRTTVSDKAAPCPPAKVNRDVQAPRPNAVWVSDFTYVATWAGFAYVAFVIDAFVRRTVGWRVSRTAHASFVLDALAQALRERRPSKAAVSSTTATAACSTCRSGTPSGWPKRGIEPSVGSVGDARRDDQRPLQDRGHPPLRPWRSLEASSSPRWNGWTGSTTAACLLEPIGNLPPAEARARFYALLEETALAA
jgi:putative transposase